MKPPREVGAALGVKGLLVTTVVLLTLGLTAGVVEVGKGVVGLSPPSMGFLVKRGESMAVAGA